MELPEVYEAARHIDGEHTCIGNSWNWRHLCTFGCVTPAHFRIGSSLVGTADTVSAQLIFAIWDGGSVAHGCSFTRVGLPLLREHHILVR